MWALAAAVVAVAIVIATAWRRRHPAPYPARLALLLDVPLPGLRHAPADVVRWLDLRTGTRVLEIGPGSGFYTRSILETGLLEQPVCLDVQPAMLQRIRQRFGTRAPNLVCGDASALPFRAGAFDRILMVTVLGEIPDRDAALRECARLLSEDGMLVVGETMLDADYVPARRLVQEAAAAGLTAVDRDEGVVMYTQRLRGAELDSC